MDFNVKMTEEEIIEEINKLKEELNNLENHNNEITNLEASADNLMKLTMGLSILGSLVLISFPIAYVPLGITLITASLGTFVFSSDNRKFAKGLREGDIKNEADYIKKIAGYGTILQHRKGEKIDNMWIKNLNVNFKNIPEVACDVKEINEEYIKGAFSNVEITEITDLLMDYLDNKDTITNENENENSDVKKLIRK